MRRYIACLALVGFSLALAAPAIGAGPSYLIQINGAGPADLSGQVAPAGGERVHDGGKVREEWWYDLFSNQGPAENESFGCDERRFGGHRLCVDPGDFDERRQSDDFKFLRLGGQSDAESRRGGIGGVHGVEHGACVGG